MKSGGAEIVMASTAYGGSSQLTDLLCARASHSCLRKHTFDIQGPNDPVESLRKCLAQVTLFANLGAQPLLPTTLIFLETPSNPEMKVPDLAALVSRTIRPFAKAHASDTRVVLLLDCTLAPGSQILSKLAGLAPELPALAFISLSKHVSQGHTTAGAVIPNHTHHAAQIMDRLAFVSNALDTTARPDQVERLVGSHLGVEGRCQRAYQVARTVGHELQEAVQRATGRTMDLAFVTPELAAEGYTSSTFSFTLPPVASSTASGQGSEWDGKGLGGTTSGGLGERTANAQLAQTFVDLLCVAHPSLFKPCVSFGQDNGKVYCTVPATSTQGAIRAEDKAKQARDGVQLVRLSFPPTMDVEAARHAVAGIVDALYKMDGLPVQQWMLAARQGPSPGAK